MNILSLADFHTPADRNDKDEYVQNVELQNSVQYFVHFISELREKEPGWIPDYLCICGDIASKAMEHEYQLAGELINQIAQACLLSDDYILMVPGNHDLNTSGMLEKKDGDWVMKEDEKKEYLHAVNQLLDMKMERKDMERLSHSFASYSDFRERFITKEIPYIAFPLSYIPKSIAYTCGYKVFEKNKTVFVELNSSWFDLPKLPVRNATRFGSLHIQWLYNRIKELKQQGYYIVTMFHHSLRYLDLQEYQTREPQFPVYDRIIEMSDLCLSGHEHGAKSKEPDMLGNECQYILNGGFYSSDLHNKIKESSASLIKIDPYNEQLTIRKFAKETDGTWYEKRPPKTYSNLSRVKNEVVHQKVDAEFSDQSVFDFTDDMKLYHRIILRFFGSNYKIVEVGSHGNFKLIHKKKENEGLCFVTFLKMNQPIVEINFKCEPNEKLIVVCLCRCNNKIDKEAYYDLKYKYKKDILKQSMIFFSLNVDF